MLRLLLAAPLLLAACDPGCDRADELAPGTARGSIGGDRWQAEGLIWQLEASGVQINSSTVDGWRLTMVAQTSDEGDPAVERVEHGRLPVEIILQAGAQGGWGLLNGEGTATYTTRDAGGGWLKLTRQRGDDLMGCYVFDAAAGRDTVTARGAFRATR